MINQLKKIFTSLTTDEHTKNKKDYLWFKTDDHIVFGIQKSELDSKETTLLDLFLTPYNGAYPPVSRREQTWYDWIFEGTDATFKAAPKSYRYIYFSLSQPLSDPEDFRAAIKGLYEEAPAVIWSSEQSGVIIEENRAAEDEQITYDEMVEVFTSDFFIDVHFFIGPYLTDLQQAQVYFQWMETYFDYLSTLQIKPVMTYVRAVPYLLSSFKEDHHAQFLVHAVLKDTIHDDELLRTIQIFLEANSNASLAAKEMYMHRNSLQYRIDKFIERTEVDVKQFEGAVSIYLILLLKRQLD